MDDLFKQEKFHIDEVLGGGEPIPGAYDISDGEGTIVGSIYPRNDEPTTIEFFGAEESRRQTFDVREVYGDHGPISGVYNVLNAVNLNVGSISIDDDGRSGQMFLFRRVKEAAKDEPQQGRDAGTLATLAILTGVGVGILGAAIGSAYSEPSSVNFGHNDRESYAVVETIGGNAYLFRPGDDGNFTEDKKKLPQDSIYREQ